MIVKSFSPFSQNMHPIRKKVLIDIHATEDNLKDMTTTIQDNLLEMVHDTYFNAVEVLEKSEEGNSGTYLNIQGGERLKTSRSIISFLVCNSHGRPYRVNAHSK